MLPLFRSTTAALVLAACSFLLLSGRFATARAAGLEGEAIDERLSFIEQRLDAGRRYAAVWQYGWTGIYAVSTAYSGVLLATADDGDDRVNYAVGTVKSLGALAGMLLDPLPTRHGADPLRSMGAGPSDHREERLRRGEGLLNSGAARAQTRTSWKRHLVGWVTNLVGGGIIWAFGEERDAVVSAVGGIIVGELNIWTEPRKAIEDHAAYGKRFPAGDQSRKIDWQLTPFPGGVAVNVAF